MESQPLVELDYFDVVDPITLEPLAENCKETPFRGEGLAIIAAKVGPVRLIDNGADLLFGPDVWNFSTDGNYDGRLDCLVFTGIDRRTPNPTPWGILMSTDVTSDANGKPESGASGGRPCRGSACRPAGPGRRPGVREDVP